MAKQTMGEIISNLRRERGMTQKDLADKMGVTDKAVSKWERDLSCPDISSLPRLAEALGTSVNVLMDVKPEAEQKPDWNKIIALILTAMPLAMGVGLAVVSVIEHHTPWSAYFFMTGLGLFCLALKNLREQ